MGGEKKKKRMDPSTMPAGSFKSFQENAEEMCSNPTRENHKVLSQNECSSGPTVCG